ncbi:hypothetical protein PENOC_112640 [Penicillium occitanis (nom. inval.)]|nr:hypothetical protein PENOC_112640 [Penicillium occitanis (nom. inval.)]
MPDDDDDDDDDLGIPGLDLGRMSRGHVLNLTDRQALEMARLRQMRNGIRPNQGRVARVRIGWSKRETRRLIKLWQMYGGAWSMIKSADEEMETPLLRARSQTDLKDKMRNVKAFMGRTGIDIPEEFGAITLGERIMESIAVALSIRPA